MWFSIFFNLFLAKDSLLVIFSVSVSDGPILQTTIWLIAIGSGKENKLHIEKTNHFFFSSRSWNWERDSTRLWILMCDKACSCFSFYCEIELNWVRHCQPLLSHRWHICNYYNFEKPITSIKSWPFKYFLLNLAVKMLWLPTLDGTQGSLGDAFGFWRDSYSKGKTILNLYRVARTSVTWTGNQR